MKVVYNWLKDFVDVAASAEERASRRALSGKDAGVASISNVVDVSNYVMLELGHPLHTFDYDLVRNHSIVVRRSKPGEKLKTLDGTERALPTDTCMIADGDGSRLVGVGGIMGGAETEISSSTKNVL